MLTRWPPPLQGFSTDLNRDREREGFIIARHSEIASSFESRNRKERRNDSREGAVCYCSTRGKNIREILVYLSLVDSLSRSPRSQEMSRAMSASGHAPFLPLPSRATARSRRLRAPSRFNGRALAEDEGEEVGAMVGA